MSEYELAPTGTGSLTVIFDHRSRMWDGPFPDVVWLMISPYLHKYRLGLPTGALNRRLYRILGHPKHIALRMIGKANSNDCCIHHFMNELEQAVDESPEVAVYYLMIESYRPWVFCYCNGNCVMWTRGILQRLIELRASPKVIVGVACELGNAEIVRAHSIIGLTEGVGEDDTIVRASYWGHVDIVAELITQTEDEGKIEAIVAACQRGHIDVLKYLAKYVERGLFDEVSPSCGNTTLYLAIHNGHRDIVELLLEECEVSVYRDYLVDAGYLGDIEIFDLEWEYGDMTFDDWDINELVHGVTALSAAIAHGNLDLAEYLIDGYDADIHAHNEDALSKVTDVGLMFLLKRGADPNGGEKRGAILQERAKFGRLQDVKTLEQFGGDLTLIDVMVVRSMLQDKDRKESVLRVLEYLESKNIV